MYLQNNNGSLGGLGNIIDDIVGGVKKLGGGVVDVLSGKGQVTVKHEVDYKPFLILGGAAIFAVLLLKKKE